MAKDTPITSFLSEEEKAMLTPAAAALTAGDLASTVPHKHRKPGTGAVPKSAAAEAMSGEDWRSVARAFATHVKHRHNS